MLKSIHFEFFDEINNNGKTGLLIFTTGRPRYFFTVNGHKYDMRTETVNSHGSL